MTTTHIDKEARARLLNLYDAFAPTCASPQLKTLLVAILDTLTPLPADVESSPKPEGLKWGCKLLPSKSGMSGMGVYSPSGKYYLYKLSLSHAWALRVKDETHTRFPSDAAALAALNSCTQPPPDFVEPAKPEAGEQRVKDLTGEVRRLRSALASVEGYQHTERTDAEKITQIKAIASDALNLDPVGICTPQPEAGEQRVLKCCDCYTPFTNPPTPQAWCHKCNKWKVPLRETILATPQPAEPKVLPWPEDLTTLVGKRITTRMKPGETNGAPLVLVPTSADSRLWMGFQCCDPRLRDLLSVEEAHPTQPSEQAKGAEPSDMAKRLTNKLWLNHLGMDVIRNYAAFAAEMEALKKGAIR